MSARKRDYQTWWSLDWSRHIRLLCAISSTQRLLCQPITWSNVLQPIYRRAPARCTKTNPIRCVDVDAVQWSTEHDCVRCHSDVYIHSDCMCRSGCREAMTWRMTEPQAARVNQVSSRLSCIYWCDETRASDDVNSPSNMRISAYTCCRDGWWFTWIFTSARQLQLGTWRSVSE